MQLRPYQAECLQAVRDAYRRGRRRVLVCLPTGTGKTVIFSSFPGFFRMKKKLLVLAHREELLTQAADKIRRINPGLPVAIEQAQNWAGGGARVVVGSVPTLGRQGSKRLARLDPDEFYLVVVDEAHHAIARTYLRIFDHFGLREEDSQRLLVGFTATPRRGDKRGLGGVFEEVVFRRGIRPMIEKGFLSPVRGLRVRTDTDLDDIAVRQGDLATGQLGETVNHLERNALVVAGWMRLARGRRTLVFCVDVAHARAMADMFTAAGIPAAAIWGAMGREARHEQLARFHRGELQVLTNCNVLIEGFDEPRVDCVMLARPTRSRLLYAQMVGRGTRLHPDKEDLLVIDVVDNTRRHTLAGLQTLFELPVDFDLQGRDAVKVAEEIEEAQEEQPWLDLSALTSYQDFKLRSRRVDMFRQMMPEELADRSQLAWAATAHGDYRLWLPDGEKLVVSVNELGQWDVRLVDREDDVVLRSRGSALDAVVAADKWVARHRKDKVRAVHLGAGWRKAKASQKQRDTLQKLGMQLPDELSRGDASMLLNQLLDKRRRGSR